MSIRTYPIPDNDEERLKVLAEYHVLDTPPEQEFDRLTNLAAKFFDVPIVLISLVDRDRQFFKARVGLDICQTDRDISICTHAIVQDDVFFVPDASQDPRFASNPVVIGSPHVRFYAGAPLRTSDGFTLGTICLIDNKPRRIFSIDKRKSLENFAALVMDRMDIRRLEYARNLHQSRFENVTVASPDAIICVNAKSLVTIWNPAAEELFGYSADKAIGNPVDMLIPAGIRQRYKLAAKQLLNDGAQKSSGKPLDLILQRSDGDRFFAEVSWWKSENEPGFGAIIRDTTNRRKNQIHLNRLASTDPLTGMFNRTSLLSHMGKMLADYDAATLLLLDLDGFKDVNDSLGHSAGDQVLKQVAKCILSFSEKNRVIARLGGDEFVVLLPTNDLREAGAVAELLIAAISEPFDIDGNMIHIGASIGIAIAPIHATTSEEMLTAADLALYQAKANGKGKFEVFHPTLRQIAIARRAYEREIRQAHANGEFELYYQPQVNLGNNELCGAEALIRWNHPKRGLLAPAAFLENLNEMSLAGPVGEWILNSAGAQAAEWRKIIPHFRMGINLFEEQFRNGCLISSVTDVLAKYGLPATALELEITENVILDDRPLIIEQLKTLQAMNVGIAFDDYGTGFASLSLLKRYPLTRLKIDRSFIQDVCTEKEDAALVKAIIHLGQIFGLEVIAEGIETSEQKCWLRSQGCNEAQGYLLGKPMSAETFYRKLIAEQYMSSSAKAS